MIHNIAAEQLADGDWQRGGAVQRAGPSPAARAPMQDSDVTRTALSLRALQVYGWEGRKADFAARIDLARAWLARTKPVYNEEYAMKLQGLRWAGAANSVTAPLVRQLAGQQRVDGGWSQNPYLESDAYAAPYSTAALGYTLDLRSRLCLKYSYARICPIGRAFRESATFMSFLTGQSKDHGKASCEQPGDEEAGGPTTNCWEPKTFSFPVDFFPNLVTIDWDLQIPLPPE